MKTENTFFKKYKKRIIAIIILIIIGFGGKTYLDMRSNDIISRYNVSFSGYNGSGSAEISNYDSVLAYMKQQALKKAGFKKDLAEQIANSKDLDTSTFPSEDQATIDAVNDELSDVKVNLSSNSTSLKNGDKVTLSFRNDSSALPFKSGTKVFKVKGLKKTTKISSKKIFNKLKVKSTGVDGKGQLVLTSSDSNLIDSTIKIKNNGHLSNGDTVTIKLPKAAFKDDSGKHQYTGLRSFDYTVSGLIDSKSISNVDDILSSTDSVMDDEIEDSIYNTAKFINLYVLPYNEYVSADAESDDEEDSIPTKITVSDSSDPDISSFNKFTIVAIYTKTDSESEDTDPENTAVTVEGLRLKDNKLNINDKKITALDNNQSIDTSIQTYKHNLEVTGLKLK